MKVTTLLFLRREGQLLLAMKKRGFGVGKWNGVGGKVDPGESVLQGAIRECQEEIGVTPTSLQRRGVLDFFDHTDPAFHTRCHIFVAETWEGEPAESEEMQPAWFGEDAIPYDSMWADDTVWLPLLLADKRFSGEVWVSDTELDRHTIREVTDLPEETASA